MKGFLAILSKSCEFHEMVGGLRGFRRGRIRIHSQNWASTIYGCSGSHFYIKLGHNSRMVRLLRHKVVSKVWEEFSVKYRDVLLILTIIACGQVKICMNIASQLCIPKKQGCGATRILFNSLCPSLRNLSAEVSCSRTTFLLMCQQTP